MSLLDKINLPLYPIDFKIEADRHRAKGGLLSVHVFAEWADKVADLLHEKDVTIKEFENSCAKYEHDASNMESEHTVDMADKERIIAEQEKKLKKKKKTIATLEANCTSYNNEIITLRNTIAETLFALYEARNGQH